MHLKNHMPRLIRCTLGRGRGCRGQAPGSVLVLTLAHCWHTLCQHRSGEVLERSNSTLRQVLAQSVLTAGP